MADQYNTVEEIIADLQAAVAAAMPSVAQAIQDTLRSHIESDVYAKYTSEVYPRKGTLLSGVDNANISTDGNSVTVTYEPNGAVGGTWAEMPEPIRRKYGMWDDDPIKPNPVSGDAFIRRIETGQGYDYKFKQGGGPGARPFLTNTVNELIEGKRALTAFIDAFNGYSSRLQAQDIGSEIFRDGNDFGGF